SGEPVPAAVSEHGVGPGDRADTAVARQLSFDGAGCSDLWRDFAQLQQSRLDQHSVGSQVTDVVHLVRLEVAGEVVEQQRRIRLLERGARLSKGADDMHLHSLVGEYFGNRHPSVWCGVLCGEEDTVRNGDPAA